MPESSGVEEEAILCSFCIISLNKEARIRCDECSAIICFHCFRMGAEGGKHRRGHNYEIVDPVGSRLFDGEWELKEELELLTSAHRYKLGNWGEIAENLKRNCTGEEAKDYFDLHFVRSTFGQTALNEAEWRKRRHDMLHDGSARMLVDTQVDPPLYYNMALEALRSLDEDDVPDMNASDLVAQVKEITRNFIDEESKKPPRTPQKKNDHSRLPKMVPSLDWDEWWEENPAKSRNSRKRDEALSILIDDDHTAPAGPGRRREKVERRESAGTPRSHKSDRVFSRKQLEMAGLEPENSDEDEDDEEKERMNDGERKAKDEEEDETEQMATPIIVVKKIQARGRTKLKAELQSKPRAKKSECQAGPSHSSREPTVSPLKLRMVREKGPATNRKLRIKKEKATVVRRRVTISSSEEEKEEEEEESMADEPPPSKRSKKSTMLDSSLEEEFEEEEDDDMDTSQVSEAHTDYDSKTPLSRRTSSAAADDDGEPKSKRAKPKRRQFGTTKRERRIKYLKRKLQSKSRRGKRLLEGDADDDSGAMTEAQREDLRSRRPYLAMDKGDTGLVDKPRLKQDDLNLLAYNADRDDYEMEYYNEAEHIVSRLTFAATEGDRQTDIENEIKLIKAQRYMRILRERRAMHKVIVEHDKIPEFFNFMKRMTVEKKKASEVMKERTEREEFIRRLQTTFTKDEIVSITHHGDRVAAVRERIQKLQELQRSGVTTLKGHEDLIGKRAAPTPKKGKRKVSKYEQETQRKIMNRAAIRWQSFKRWQMKQLASGQR